jgi:hypothetical protein
MICGAVARFQTHNLSIENLSKGAFKLKQFSNLAGMAEHSTKVREFLEINRCLLAGGGRGDNALAFAERWKTSPRVVEFFKANPGAISGWGAELAPLTQSAQAFLNSNGHASAFDTIVQSTGEEALRCHRAAGRAAATTRGEGRCGNHSTAMTAALSRADFFIS